MRVRKMFIVESTHAIGIHKVENVRATERVVCGKYFWFVIEIEKVGEMIRLKFSNDWIHVPVIEPAHLRFRKEEIFA